MVTENPTEEDPKDILNQDTESEETETKDTSDTLRSSPRFYQERVLPADQKMNESGTSSTNIVASSGSILGRMTATEAITVPEATEHESAEEDDDSSTGPNDIVEGTETSANEVEIDAQKVTKAATSYSQPHTATRTNSRVYLDREETMYAELEQLKEDNLTRKRSLVSLSRVLSSRHHEEALTGD